MYATDREEMVYSSTAKKRFNLSSDGLLYLKTKGSVNFGLGNRKWAQGCVELKQKVYNVTEEQDVKLTAGCEVSSTGRKSVYGKLQENNWSVQYDLVSRRWAVKYFL